MRKKNKKSKLHEKIDDRLDQVVEAAKGFNQHDSDSVGLEQSKLRKQGARK